MIHTHVRYRGGGGEGGKGARIREPASLNRRATVCRKRVWETSEPVISPRAEKVFSARRYNDRGG